MSSKTFRQTVGFHVQVEPIRCFEILVWLNVQRHALASSALYMGANRAAWRLQLSTSDSYEGSLLYGWLYGVAATSAKLDTLRLPANVFALDTQHLAAFQRFEFDLQFESLNAAVMFKARFN
jgi:hypothetical protein